LKKEETEMSRSPHREEFLERLVSAFPTGKTAISDSFGIPESVSRRRWLAGVAAPVRRSLQFYPGAARRGASRRDIGRFESRPSSARTFAAPEVAARTWRERVYAAGTKVQQGEPAAGTRARENGPRQSRRDQEARRYTPRIQRVHVTSLIN